MTGIPLEISTKLVRSESSCHYEYIFDGDKSYSRIVRQRCAFKNRERNERERRFSIGKLFFSIVYKNIKTTVVCGGNSDNAQVGNWKSDGEVERRVEKREGYYVFTFSSCLRRRKCFYKCRDNPSEALDCRRVGLHASKGRGVAVIVYP